MVTALPQRAKGPANPAAGFPGGPGCGGPAVPAQHPPRDRRIEV